MTKRYSANELRESRELTEGQLNLNESPLPAGRQGETNHLRVRVISGLPAAHATGIDVDETRARVVADAAALQR